MWHSKVWKLIINYFNIYCVKMWNNYKAWNIREIGEISPSHVQAPTNKKSKKRIIATRTPPQKEGGGALQVEIFKRDDDSEDRCFQ